MKGNLHAREDHLVPVSAQAVGVLKEIRALRLSDEYVFPVKASAKARHTYMSENTLQIL